MTKAEEREDFNDNGTTDDTVNLGGHIISAMPITVDYVNSDNESLHPQLSITGELPDGTLLHNYLVSQGPDIPAPLDVYAPTPEETQAIQEVLSAYYRVGDAVTTTLPDIDGYVTPEPTTRTFTLSATDEENSHAITYLTQAEVDAGINPNPVDDSSAPVADTSETDDSNLAATGTSMKFIVTAIAAVLVIGATMFAVVLRRDRV